MAHPITSDENFHVSVLVGADYYWQFIQDHVVRGDGPTAVQSRLGYLLSGPLPSPQHTDTTSLHVSILSCTTGGATPSRFWNMESTGTTCVTETSDADFLHGNQKGPIASSFLGRIPILPFPPTTLFVIEEPDPLFIGWQRHQNF